MRVLVVALSCLFVQLPSWATGENEPTTTTLCEIVKNPQQFDGRTVKVRATVFIGFEASLLRDDGCGSAATVWVEFGDKPPSPSRDTQYAFIGSRDDLQHPESLQWHPIESHPPIRVKADAEFQAFDGYVNQRLKSKGGDLCLDGCPLYSVAATFTGRVDFADHRLRAYRNAQGKLSSGGNGFGHGAWDARLVVESVSHTVAVKIDPKIYQPKK